MNFTLRQLREYWFYALKKQWEQFLDKYFVYCSFALRMALILRGTEVINPPTYSWPTDSQQPLMASRNLVQSTSRWSCSSIQDTAVIFSLWVGTKRFRWGLTRVSVEANLWARWPWFSTQILHRVRCIDLGIVLLDIMPRHKELTIWRPFQVKIGRGGGPHGVVFCWQRSLVR